MYTQSYGILAAAGIFLLIFWLIMMALIVVNIVAMWKLFKKAGKPGWAAIIPFYNTYILNEMVWGKGIYFLFMLIPLGNLVWMVATYIKLAHSFNKGTGYGVALVFFGYILIPVLAFGKAEYIGYNDSGKKGCIIGAVVTGIVWFVMLIVSVVIAIFSAVSYQNQDIHTYDYDYVYEEDDYGLEEQGQDEETGGIIEASESDLDLSGYDDVSAVNLDNGEAVIQMPIQNSDTTECYGSMAFSSKSGVNVSLSLSWYPIEDESELAEDVATEVESEVEYMESSEFYGDVTVDEMLTGDGWALQQYNYSYLLGDNAYPCFTIVKADNMDGYLVTINIEVDNSMADENTEEVLMQACELYGVDFALE